MTDLDKIYQKLIKDGETDRRPGKRSKRRAWRAVKTREASLKPVPMWFANQQAEDDFVKMMKENPLP